MQMLISYAHYYDGFSSSTIPVVKKKKNKFKGSTKASLWLDLWLAIEKEVLSKPKQPSYKKGAAPKKGQGEKSCEIKVVAKKGLQWQVNGKNFNNDNSGEFYA